MPRVPAPRGRGLTVLPSPLRRLRAAVERSRREPPPEPVSLGLLVLASVLGLVGSLTIGPQYVPAGVQVLPLLGGALLLGRSTMLRLLAVVAVGLVVTVWDESLRVVRPGTVVIVVLTGLLSYALSRSREETGLVGLRGDSVLSELRRRLTQQGQVPALPRGWRAEARISPAGGGPFSGDFVVSALTTGGRRLEVALVDVSGKGVAAGTRSLLLSGAMGGLLGARSPSELLPAANAYLHRQAWDEGFATAAHLVVELDTGAFLLESAGHPPAAHFDAGSGRWSLVDAGGPALGLLPDVAYDAVRGRLQRGDALLLYTDGLVEVPGRDLELGIDKLLGEAERLVPRGFTGGCDELLLRVAAGEGDDRGVVLVWREG
ncbi:MAG: serine phosphatase [Frankiales bacterium]|nr:serine phosphatase [Frankiales bacterium]